MEEMNELPLQEFTTEKMTATLAQMHPIKASSSDNIPVVDYDTIIISCNYLLICGK